MSKYFSILNIGLKIKELRTSLGLSQSDFGKELGISRATISQIELNLQNPTLETLHQIATKYNIDHSYFFTDVSINNITNHAKESPGEYITKKIKEGDSNCDRCQLLERLISTQQQTIDALSSRIKDFERRINH